MGAPNRELPLRIAVSKPTSSLPVQILICEGFVFTIIFMLLAWSLHSEALWWLSALVATASTWWLYRQHVRGGRDWDRVAFLEMRDGRIAFAPNRNMRQRGYTKSDAPFPFGSRLEYHIETGDYYFTGDHGQFLQSTLWVIEPNGTKWRLLDSGFGLDVKTMAANLQACDIGFRAVKIYDGERGEHTEADITEARLKARNMSALGILIGTSSLWLGVIAGSLVHNTGRVVAIGVLGYAVLPILTIFSKTSKRTSLIRIATGIPSYAAGYACMVFVVRNALHR